MTVSIRHAFESSVPDSATNGLIKPSHWNALHQLSMDTGKLLGRTSGSSGAAEEIAVDGGLALSGLQLFLTDAGATPGTYVNPSVTVDVKGRITAIQNGPDAGAIGPLMTVAAYDPQGIEDDAFARANHTGEQEISTVTGLQAALDDTATAAQGALADSAVQPAAIANMLETGDIGVSVQAYDAVLAATTASFTTDDETKLDGIEASADVTDATNVASAGAFMKASDDSDDITEGSTKLLMTTTERTRLGQLESGDSPQFAGIELSHASENTLTAASGWLSVESNVQARRTPVASAFSEDFTLAAADAGAIRWNDSTTSETVTIPTNTSVPLPVGTVINLINRASGAVTVADGDTGVTVNGSSGGSVTCSTRWQGLTLIKVDTDEWIVSGAIDA